MEKEEGKVTEQDIIDLLTKMQNKMDGLLGDTKELLEDTKEMRTEMNSGFDRIDKKLEDLSEMIRKDTERRKKRFES